MTLVVAYSSPEESLSCKAIGQTPRARPLKEAGSSEVRSIATRRGSEAIPANIKIGSVSFGYIRTRYSVRPDCSADRPLSCLGLSAVTVCSELIWTFHLPDVVGRQLNHCTHAYLGFIVTVYIRNMNIIAIDITTSMTPTLPVK